MTPVQMRIVQRLRRAMTDAKKAGLVTFVDVEAWGIRLVPADEIAGDEDPRDLGEVANFPPGTTQDPGRTDGEPVQVQSVCGTPFNNCPNM